MLIIVDYGVGNLNSIRNMFRKVGVESLITGKEEDISNATSILLPGMGSFDNCMMKFNDSGIRPIVEKKAFSDKIPVLGICVGLQMMMRKSDEGILPGLGWINGDTIAFDKVKMKEYNKVPNMGWLDVKFDKDSSLSEDLSDSRFYFAHSYHVDLDNKEDVLISANYGYDFVAGIQHNNLVGVQFHPEKSHRFGMQFLKNFVQLK